MYCTGSYCFTRDIASFPGLPPFLFFSFRDMECAQSLMQYEVRHESMVVPCPEPFQKNEQVWQHGHTLLCTGVLYSACQSDYRVQLCHVNCYACDQIYAQVGVVLFDKALMLLWVKKLSLKQMAIAEAFSSECVGCISTA